MADEIDRGNDTAELFLDIARRKRAESGPPPVGQCYNCQSPVPPGARWCDSDCRSDWEYRNKRSRV